tara:strand:+ start:5101 stop:5580 length:480 start_codon:yes stop_codon:yes gene_type:complete
MSDSDEITVIVEIPYMSNVKYEVEDGKLCVDRVLPVPMMYPGNYGFIPKTLAGDGDPVDVLIINSTAFLPMCHVKCRVLGMLETVDEKGPDEKVIAVPVNKVENTFDEWINIDNVPKNTLNYIEHFFKYYKCNEKDKWVEVGKFVNKEETLKFIEKSRK